jgi:peptide/nickel transport system permease protein
VRRAAVILLAAVFALLLCAGWIAPYESGEQIRADASAAPSRLHPLGTDGLGRDRFSRLLYGGRISMLAAPAAALLSVLVALAASLVVACLGVWAERVFHGITDLFLSLPWLFLLLTVRALLPLNVPPAVSIAVTFALLGLLGWAGPSRILLAAARTHLASDFALGARCAGTPVWRVALVHVLPNLLPVALAQFAITAPAFLISEANLALLGLGVAEPTPSWGNLLRELEDFSRVARQPWILAPLLALALTVTCFHLAVTGEDAA